MFLDRGIGKCLYLVTRMDSGVANVLSFTNLGLRLRNRLCLVTFVIPELAKFLCLMTLLDRVLGSSSVS